MTSNARARVPRLDNTTAVDLQADDEAAVLSARLAS